MEHRGWPTCRDYYEASCWGLVQREGMLSVWGIQWEAKKGAQLLSLWSLSQLFRPR